MKKLYLSILFVLYTNIVVSLSMENNLTNISGVYYIENIINGKKYIGESYDCRIRVFQHKSALLLNRHRSSLLQKDFNNQKIEDFKSYLLIACDENSRKFLEGFYIKCFKAEYNTEKNKPVEKLHPKTGEILESYISAREAGRKNDISYSAIGLVCRGIRYKAGTFRWKFKGAKEKGVQKKEKAVIAKDKKTLEVVGEYNSIKEASEKTGCDYSNIIRCLSKTQGSSKGLLWNYKT